MVWNISDASHTTYVRNPLVAVVAQLRFYPVLKIDPGRAEIGDFQDVVRKEFPRYGKNLMREIRIDPLTRELSEVLGNAQFRFTSEDEQQLVTLSKESLAVETKSYKDHDSFLRSVNLAVDALVQVFREVVPTRLGLRYVNQIVLEDVSRDLGETCDWGSLVRKDLLQIPRQVSSLEGTIFASEVTSPRAEGAITLRYGLRRPSEGGSVFMIDIDRYQTSSLSVDTVLSRLEEFSEDCSALFEAFRGEALERWMSEKEA